MSKYIDGYVVPVPKDRVDDYQDMAAAAGKIWMEHGALAFFENVGDDLDVKGLVTFPQMANLKPDEVPVFSWIVYESKEQRDAINAKAMSDPRMNALSPENPPFDFPRMAFGGFKNIVEFSK